MLDKSDIPSQPGNGGLRVEVASVAENAGAQSNQTCLSGWGLHKINPSPLCPKSESSNVRNEQNDGIHTLCKLIGTSLGTLEAPFPCFENPRHCLHLTDSHLVDSKKMQKIYLFALLLVKLQHPVRESCTMRRLSSFCKAVNSLLEKSKCLQISDRVENMSRNLSWSPK